jgi:hypothetical protein
MKKKLEKGLIALGQTWFGITNPFSSSFETYGGATSKAVVLINWLISVSAIVAVIIIIYGGFNMTTSAGDPEKFEQAQHTINAGIIGLIIIFTAGLVIRYVAQLL